MVAEGQAWGEHFPAIPKRRNLSKGRLMEAGS